MRSVFVVFIIFAAVLAAGVTSAQEVWVGKDGNIRNIDMRAMVIAGGEMYLATRNEVYRTVGPKQKLEPVFALPSAENEIQCITGRGKEMFVGTRQGVFKSSDRGRQWSKIFKAIVPKKNDILSMGIGQDGGAVIGTGKGVFVAEGDGSRWRDASGVLKNKRIGCIVCGNGAVYAGADAGVYIKKAGSGDWERASIRSSAVEGSESAAAEPEAIEVEEYGVDVDPCLALKGVRLYAGIGRKISYTEDYGKSWSDVGASGLAGAVTCILPSEASDVVYCATTKGVFEFSSEKKKWLELYRGADKVFDVRSIVFDKEGEKILWAATSKGLYRYESGRFIAEEFVDVEKIERTAHIIFDGEPPFEELQKAAMKLAEVDPDKIKKWRTQARLKALVPKISVGMDKSTSNTYEIYTSATKDYVTTGPDDINNGFDVSVSWELGDMIWSDDQTNIDVRSRLTTQLRNDILDDLRRAYYERKRLQFDMLASPSKDVKLRFEKELRIRELTQVLDDLTGNYFSSHLRSDA